MILYNILRHPEKAIKQGVNKEKASNEKRKIYPMKNANIIQ